MENLQQFEQKHPLDKGPFTSADANTIAAFKDKLPDFLLDAWAKNGFASYGNGFFWLINPDKYTDIAKGLLPKYPTAIPFLRTGLAGIFFLHDGNISFFESVYNEIVHYPDFTMEQLFNILLTDDNVLNEDQFEPLYTAAFPRLGMPAEDECYGFFPAIPLGGDLSPENLKKVKLAEYLSIISQL
ncbi:T6SS immunity protein Tdi1 domain-containing protein [Chitinophaga sp. Cy-1792]|uniref:T6SS immunity protein Tdi1 domain-containing protein n=1 Tax=Chitinophaga sp. Cy-1792 TaxID=2608339 RepID=UPI001423859A|nr:T6SS immunity protein Tdi1 domain-containing protein [Chitinophaga sp. Cy-1792]NIG53818.1 DUF1851 domain-containing protein [Chitinophaga sp. Cy-1792]